MSHVHFLAAEEIVNHLPLPVWAFPLIAVVFFVLAGVITFSFRDVANRHREKVIAKDAAGASEAHH